MKRFIKVIEWIKNNISSQIEKFVLVFVLACVLFGIFSSMKSCSAELDYDPIDANFIGEEADLHGEDFLIKVLEVNAVDEISIKKEKHDEDLSKMQGNFVAVTVSITCNNAAQTHIFDTNDFKLKDHKGTKLPTNEIFSLIDLNVPEIIISNGDQIDSDIDFETKTAIKDYTWVGTEISNEVEIVFTIYFKLETNLSFENKIAIFEADFYTGYGKNKSATDIVLCERETFN